MAARSVGSGTISFGLVSIPIKLFTATSPKAIGFNMLHKECGSRLKQQLICGACIGSSPLFLSHHYRT